MRQGFTNFPFVCQHTVNPMREYVYKGIKKRAVKAKNEKEMAPIFDNWEKVDYL